MVFIVPFGIGSAVILGYFGIEYVLRLLERRAQEASIGQLPRPFYSQMDDDGLIESLSFDTEDFLGDDFNPKIQRPLSKTTFPALRQLRSLKKLNVNNMHLNDEAIWHIAQLPHLEVLSAANTSMSHAGLTHLSLCPTLRLVSVDGATWSEWDGKRASKLREGWLRVWCSSKDLPRVEGELAEYDHLRNSVKIIGLKSIRGK
jgi:hypothetical protein